MADAPSEGSLWKRLTEPGASVGGEDRRRYTLLASLLVTLAPSALAASTLLPTLTTPGFSLASNPGAQMGIAAAVGLFAAYLVLRRGHIGAASWTMIAVGAIGVWGATILNRQTDGPLPLFFLAVVVLIASLLLPLKQTAWVGIGNLVGLAAYPALFRDVEPRTITIPFAFVGLLTILVLVHTRIRGRHVAQLELQSERLAESEERYRNLFETSFEGLSIDEQGRVIDGNALFGPLFGYSDEEVNGMPLDRFLSADCHALLEGGTDTDAVEACGVRKDGSTFPVSLVRRSARHRGRIVRVIAWRDLTEDHRRASEVEESRRRVAMSEKLSSLGTLVAGVGHEINNPLAYMRGTVDLAQDLLRETLARDDLPPDVRATLAEILENEAMVLRGISRIDHITSSLKRVARAGNGARVAEDANVLVDSVLTVAAPRLKGGVTVERDFRATKKVHVNGSEVSQILLNLVFNAADAVAGTKDAKIVLRTYDAGDRVVTEVEDTGPGIPPAEAASIFTPFHTTKPQGTGLGLSLSFRIAEDHGGRLSFASKPGSTTFRLELPCAPPAEDVESAPRTQS